MGTPTPHHSWTALAAGLLLLYRWTLEREAENTNAHTDFRFTECRHSCHFCLYSYMYIVRNAIIRL